MEEKRRRDGGHADPLCATDVLLRVFSFLSPFDLARASTVCHTWASVIQQSSLWKEIYEKSSKNLESKLKHLEKNTEKLEFLRRESETVADSKAQFVKEQHKAVVVLGSNLIKEWKGHSTRVECCRFKMEIIMTGSSDGTVHAWSTRDLRCLETYLVPTKLRVIDLEFDENKVLVVCTTEIYVWNRGKGQLLRHIKTRTQPIHSMCYADPEVLIGCADGTIRVFDIYSGRCSRIFRQHSDRVTCIGAHVSLSLLASGSADGNVHLCDIMTGEKLKCLLQSLPPRGIVCLHVCSEANMIFVGTTTGGVHAWNLRTKQLLWNIRVASNSITSLHLQFYDASTLFVGSINDVITILDSESGSVLKRYVVARRGKEMQRDESSSSSSSKSAVSDNGLVGMSFDSLPEKEPRVQRLPILCLRAGMTKLVTTHPNGSIRLWHFQL